MRDSGERPDEHADDHDDFGGLARDLPHLVGRRAILGLFAGAGLTALAACTSSKITGSSATTSAAASASAASTAADDSATSASSSAAATCTTTDPIPTETAGPFPGDGSNGPDVLTQSGVVRSDIRSSFGSSTTTAAGVPLTFTLALQDADGACAPLAGAAVYVWHCDRDGEYSMYGNGVTNENYLRGVQVADVGGKVTFSSIFPAAYSGRWPHIHFEVYENVAAATGGKDPIRTSQLALPQDVCQTVYATSGYAQSASNLARISLASDMVFRDDSAVHQLATVTGSVSAGYTATLAVPV